MRGFFGGLILGLAVAAVGAAMLSLTSPLAPILSATEALNWLAMAPAVTMKGSHGVTRPITSMKPATSAVEVK